MSILTSIFFEVGTWGWCAGGEVGTGVWVKSSYFIRHIHFMEAVKC